MSDILWQPSPERIHTTRMDQFRRFINDRHALQINDYPTLHQWSIDQRPDFWAAIVEFFDVQFRTPPSTVLVEGTQMPSAQWFPGATLNFAEHLLRRRDDHPGEQRLEHRFLVGKIAIERRLGDLRRLSDRLHRGGAQANSKDQSARCIQDARAPFGRQFSVRV